MIAHDIRKKAADRYLFNNSGTSLLSSGGGSSSSSGSMPEV
jgi:hypothetical protein